MAVESVKIRVVDDSLEEAPINGVSVRILDENGLVITSAVSGETLPGLIDVDLPGSTAGTVYEVRFFKIGMALPPTKVRVFSPASLAWTQTNHFKCVAEMFKLEPSADPRMCRVSGFVSNAARKKRSGCVLVVIPKFNAFTYEASVVTPGRFLVRADADGFVTFDLFRYAMYTITIEGQEESTRDVQVPNRPALAITSLLFPVVQRVDFVPAPSLVDTSYTVAVDQGVSLTPTIIASDYRVLEGTGTEDVGYSTDDPSIASVYILGDRIEVRGHATGTTTLRVSRLDDSVVSLPDLGVIGGVVTIHVTAA